VSLAALFLVITAILVWRDRKDLSNYIFVAIGFLYLGQTDPGRKATGWLNGAGKWLDEILRNFIPGLN
jgi:hypothetical protein